MYGTPTVFGKKAPPSTLRSRPRLTAKEVFDAAKAGDALAAEVLDHCLHFLGKMLADVSYVVDPEVFVLGGGLSAAGEYLLQIVEKHYEKYPLLKKETAAFALAKLGNHAEIT